MHPSGPVSSLAGHRRNKSLAVDYLGDAPTASAQKGDNTPPRSASVSVGGTGHPQATRSSTSPQPLSPTAARSSAPSIFVHQPLAQTASFPVVPSYSASSLSAAAHSRETRTSSIGHGASIRHDQWTRVSGVIISLFQTTVMIETVELMNDCVTLVMKSEMGHLINEHFKDRLLTKGMIILRETLKDLTGRALLERLSDIWLQYFTIILPQLQAIFCPLQNGNNDIRRLSLGAFRDHVILSSAVRPRFEEALASSQLKPGRIMQMLLVLQGIRLHDENETVIQSIVSASIPYLTPPAGQR